MKKRGSWSQVPVGSADHTTNSGSTSAERKRGLGGRTATTYLPSAAGCSSPHRGPPPRPREATTGGAAWTGGWQTFARAGGQHQCSTLHFKSEGDATLYVRVFGEDGRRDGCCPEDDGRGHAPSPDISWGEGGGGRAGRSARGPPSSGDSPSDTSTSSGGRDQPPCRCQNRRISGRGSRTVCLGGW